jgi:hypothetical protein
VLNLSRRRVLKPSFETLAAGSLFGSALLLKRLCDEATMIAVLRPSSLEGLDREKMRGYLLLGCALLSNMIKEIVDFPQILGFKRNDALSRSYNQRRGSLRLVLSDLGSSAASSTVRGLLFDMRESFRALSSCTLHDLFQSMRKLSSRLERIIEVMNYFEVSDGSRRWRMRRFVQRRLWDIMCSAVGLPRIFQFAYPDVMLNLNDRQSTIYDLNEYLESSDLSSSPRCFLPLSLLPGYSATLSWLWASVLPTKQNDGSRSDLDALAQVRDWDYVRAFSDRMIRTCMRTGLRPAEALKWKLSMKHEIPMKLREAIAVSSAVKAKRSKLEKTFSGYRVKSIADDTVATIGFMLALIGSVRIGARKLKIIRFIHDPRDHRYSYALELPGQQRIFWVFLNAAGESGPEVLAINNLLERVRERIRQRSVRCEFEELEQYSKSQYVQELESNNTNLYSSNVLLRSWALELLTAQYFREIGCTSVLFHRKYAGSDMDVVGITNAGAVHLAQCKATMKSFPVTVTDSIRPSDTTDFWEDLKKFELAYERASANKEDLRTTLQIDQQINHVQGYFVTTEIWRDLHKASKKVQAWNWYTTRSKFREQGVPSEYIEAMEKVMNSELHAALNPFAADE